MAGRPSFLGLFFGWVRSQSGDHNSYGVTRGNTHRGQGSRPQKGRRNHAREVKRRHSREMPLPRREGWLLQAHGATQENQRPGQAFASRPWAPHACVPPGRGGGAACARLQPPPPRGGRAPRRSPPPAPLLSGFPPSQAPPKDFSTPDNKGGGRAASVVTQRRARPRPAPPLPSGEAGPAPRVWRGRAAGSQSVSQAGGRWAAAGLPASLPPPAGRLGVPLPSFPALPGGESRPGEVGVVVSSHKGAAPVGWDGAAGGWLREGGCL